MEIPVKWLETILVLIGVCGLSLGTFSFLAPKESIQLYQAMMAFFNWKVDPINWKRELATTKVLGVTMAILSVLIFAALMRSGCLRCG